MTDPASFYGRTSPANQQMAAMHAETAAKHAGPMQSSGLKKTTTGLAPRGGKRTSGGWNPH
jgi:hypothetical protein